MYAYKTRYKIRIHGKDYLTTYSDFVISDGTYASYKDEITFNWENINILLDKTTPLYKRIHLKSMSRGRKLVLSTHPLFPKTFSEWGDPHLSGTLIIDTVNYCPTSRELLDYANSALAREYMAEWGINF